MTDPTLLDGLAPQTRLALAYAPGAVRPLYLALFALDARLGAIVSSAREPMLAQLKLAWWREQLEKPADQRAKGQPLLAALDPWGANATGFQTLVSGWEHLLPHDNFNPEDLISFSQARGSACAALAELVGSDPLAARLAGEWWGLGDLARPAESFEVQALVTDLAARLSPQRPQLDRNMRPLLVLHELARRSVGRPSAKHRPGDLLTAMRLGMFGI